MLAKNKRSAFEEQEGDTSFVCERVCTSDRLLKRLGYLAKVRARAALRAGWAVKLPAHARAAHQMHTL